MAPKSAAKGVPQLLSLQQSLMTQRQGFHVLAERARAVTVRVDRLICDFGCLLLQEPRLPADLDTALAWLRAAFAGCDDIVFREFTTGLIRPWNIGGGGWQATGGRAVRAALIFIDGLPNDLIVNEHVLAPLMSRRDSWGGGESLMEEVRNRLVPAGEVREVDNPGDLAKSVLSGDAALLLDGEAAALLVSVQGWDKRAIEKPEHKAVMKGPKDSFTETMRVNTTLLRRRLRDNAVKVRAMEVGRVTKTSVAVVYHQQIANPSLVAEVVRRLEAVDVDGVVDSGVLEQLIGDKPLSIFPALQESERPDEVAAAILEGRVAILVDNTPFVLLAPATFNNMMMAPEDYYVHWPVATFVRVMRYIAALLALTLPSIYIILTSFHPEIFPVELGVFIAGSREGRPFPVLTEILMMEITMEILREATIRLPGAFGQAISVVGTLVVGQAAVRAGLVSAVVIIITGSTAVASFAVPSMALAFAVRLLRFPLMLLSGMFGATGMFVGLYILLVHLACLRSFGVEYLAPFGPLYWSDLKDAVLRLPLRFLRRRPWEYHPRDTARGPGGGGG